MHIDQSTFQQTQSWTVLRCGSSKTLLIAKRLADYGAWTPIWQRKRRKPRSHKIVDLELPAIPSFVFIPTADVDSLPPVAGAPYKPMRIDGCIVRIADLDLAHLRRIDEASKAKQPKKKFGIGQRIKFHSGPFTGLKGKVVYQASRFVTCMIEGFSQPIQIASCALDEIAA